MPKYTYECETCEDQIQIWHSIKEDPEVICDSCGNKRTRAITGFGLIKMKGLNSTGLTRSSKRGVKNGDGK